MKVERVKIKEFKCLEDFEADFNGSVVLLRADNGLGKTSCMQFIEIALGKKANIPPGATGEGEVYIDKDGKTWTFKVKFRDGKPVIEVTSPDGLKDTRKGTISNIVGAIEFDIHEFAELSKTTSGRKKQVEIFKSFLPDEVQKDLNNYEAHVRAAYEERTELNRHIKDAEAFVKNHPLYGFGSELENFQPINTTEVYAQLKQSNEKNQKIAEVKARQENRINEIKSLETKLAELRKQSVDAGSWLADNPVIDITDLEQKINQANETNKKYEQAQELKKKQDLLKQMNEDAGDLTAKIDSQRQAIQDTIKQMDSPVENLTYDNDVLVYNNVPVHPDSLSTSEIMELGIRMKAAENPELPIFIPQSESIGQQRWEAIMKFAKDQGRQIIAEEVVRGKEELTVEIVGE